MALRAPSACPYCTRAHYREDACETVKRMARERKARFDRKRPNSSQRGYDRQFEEAARAYLQEPGNDLCQCGARAVLVAHRRSIRSAPHLRMERSNWRPSCARCNAIDAARERRKEGLR